MCLKLLNLFIPLSLLSSIVIGHDIPNEQLQKDFLERIKQLSKFVDFIVVNDSPNQPKTNLQQEFICGHDERQVTAINETTSKIDICCLDRKGSISTCSSSRCGRSQLQGRQPFITARTCTSGCNIMPLTRYRGGSAVSEKSSNRFFCTGIIDIYESVGCARTSKKTVQLNGQKGQKSQARFCCPNSCTAYFDCPSSGSGSRSCCKSSNKEYCDGDQFTEPDYGPEYKPPPAGVPTQAPTKSPSGSSGSSQQQQQQQEQTVVVNCRTTNVELIKSFKETTDILERISNRINSGLRMVSSNTQDNNLAFSGNRTFSAVDRTKIKSSHQNGTQDEHFFRALSSIPNQVFSVINKISQSATRDIGPDIFQFFRVITE